MHTVRRGWIYPPDGLKITSSACLPRGRHSGRFFKFLCFSPPAFLVCGGSIQGFLFLGFSKFPLGIEFLVSLLLVEIPSFGESEGILNTSILRRAEPFEANICGGGG